MIPSLQIGQFGRGVPTELGVVDETVVRRGLRSKIVSFWEFNNTLADTGRANVTWSGTGTYTTGPSGAANTALAAAGSTTQSLVTAKGMSAYSTGQAFSFGGFVRSANASASSIRYANGAGTVVCWRLEKGVSGWGTSIRVGASQETVYSGNHATGWVHVIITVNNGTVRIYIDGVLTTTGSVTVGATAASSADRYEIIRNVTDHAQIFFAHDEISADEAAYLYNNGNGRAASEFMAVSYGTTPDAYAATLSLNRYYKYNETSGTAANDEGSDNADATLTNGAAFSISIDPPAGFSTADYVADNDGSNDFIDHPDWDMSSGSKSFTWGAWVNRDTLATGDTFFYAGTNTASAANGIELRCGNSAGGEDDLAITVYDGAGASLAGTGAANVMPSTATWYYIGVTYDQTNDVYLIHTDGLVQIGIVDADEPPAVNRTEVYTAKGRSNLAGNFVDGKFSREFLKRQGALSPPQFAKLYDLGNGSG